LKVYLSVPMVLNRSLRRAEVMAEAIEAAGHEVTSPWVLAKVEATPRDGINIFERDKAAAQASDVLVADVSAPSIGVGMEIMAAHSAGRRIILVAKGGSIPSRMLQHMERKEVIPFDEDESLGEDLKSALSRHTTQLK